MRDHSSGWKPPVSGDPARVLCLGGGAICAATMDHLLGLGCLITVLDKDRHCAVAERCKVCSSPADLWCDDVPALLVGDAISTALDILERSDIDLLVPSIPGHAVAKMVMAWGKGRLSPWGSAALLQELNRLLEGRGIATMDPDSGTVIATLNTGSELCPRECTQQGPCPLTGELRHLDMCKVLEEVLDRMSIKGAVLRTGKVGEFGAITGKDLEAAKELLEGTVEGDVIGIATSCACHAILNLFKVC